MDSEKSNVGVIVAQHFHFFAFLRQQMTTNKQSLFQFDQLHLKVKMI